MTKPLNQITKMGVLIFGVSMFFTACDKDIAEIHEHESHDSNLFSTLDFKTFKVKVADKDISNSDVNKLIFSKSIPIGELQYTPQSQSQSFVTRIDSTDVLMAEKDGITSFTFKTQTTDRSKTTNYVLAYDNESVEEFYITYEDNGSGRIIDPTSGYEVTTMSSGSVWCPIAEEVWLCNCADHVMGSCTGVCSSGFYQTTIITYEYCGSSLGEGSSGGGIGSGSGDGEGTGGGNGGSTGGGNDLPLDGEIITKQNKKLCEIGYISDENSSCVLYDDYKILNKLTGKALCVYNKLKSSSTGFKNAIKKFEPEFPVAHIKFDMGDIGTSRGITIAPNSNPTTPNSPDFVITVRLNNNSTSSGVTQRPNLLIAKTIAHEIIHAEMYRKLLSVLDSNGSFDGVTRQDVLDALSNGDFPGMYDYFRRHKNWQHQQMATHYRESLARILQEYDTGVAVPDNQQPSQLYMDLSWEGLKYPSIHTWSSLPQTEKDRLNDVISDYVSDNLNQTCTE